MMGTEAKRGGEEEKQKAMHHEHDPVKMVLQESCALGVRLQAVRPVEAQPQGDLLARLHHSQAVAYPHLGALHGGIHSVLFPVDDEAVEGILGEGCVVGGTLTEQENCSRGGGEREAEETMVSKEKKRGALKKEEETGSPLLLSFSVNRIDGATSSPDWRSAGPASSVYWGKCS